MTIRTFRYAAMTFMVLAALAGAQATAQQRAGEPELRPPAEVPGITPEVLVRTTVPGAPGKLALAVPGHCEITHAPLPADEA